MSSKKIIRYYYWLFKEFVKKNLKLILISFFLSFVLIIGLISVTPFINTYFFRNSQVIGLVGNYHFKNIPEEITAKISNGLVFINDKGEIVPALASSWEQLDNGKVNRFHLRRSLLWSDGKVFSAYDIDYTFPDVEVKVADAYTIDFILKKPLSIFPTYLTKPIIKYPLNGIAGLYKVSRIKTKYGNITEISLSPNKKNMIVITYKIFDSESKLINAYKLGEINIIRTTKFNVAEFFKNWKNTKVDKSVDYSQVLTVFFNMKHDLLKNNSDLRQAIINMIPMQILTNRGELASGPIAPISWAFNPNLKKKSYDTDLAKKMIEKYQEPKKPITLDFLTDYDYLDEAETISESLKSQGLKINLKFISFSKQNDFDLLLAYWKVPLDPDQYYFWHSTQTKGNITGYNKPKIDKLLEDGRNTLLMDDRKTIYQKFQEVFLDDPPAYFLYFPYIYEIRRK